MFRFLFLTSEGRGFMSSIKFVGFTSLLVTMLFVGQVNAQQATIVQGSVASSAGQVKALEEKV